MGRAIAVSRQLLVGLVVVLALGVLASAYAKGEGWLGVMLQPLSDDLKDAMGIGNDVSGVLIGDVVPDSPAEAAGVEKGDIIIEIDGKSIGSADQAISAVKSYAPGEKVKLVVLREGKKEVLTAVLGDRAAADQALAEKEIIKRETAEKEAPEGEDYYNLKLPRLERVFRDFRSEAGARLGVTVQNVSADLGQYFGVRCCEGVLVVAVTEDSPAQKAGLRDGDVITKVDGKDVTGSDELVEYIQEHQPGDKVELTFKRNREIRRTEVELAESQDIRKIFIKRAGKPGQMGDWGCMPKEGNLEEHMEMMKPYPPGADVREEIDKLNQEIEKLREEIEALKKP